MSNFEMKNISNFEFLISHFEVKDISNF